MAFTWTRRRLQPTVQTVQTRRLVLATHAALDEPEAGNPHGDEDDPECRCGWLDSSLDLRQGLAVIEHPVLDLGLTLDLLLGPDAARSLQASRPAR